jgi:sialate O-acetylesterase
MAITIDLGGATAGHPTNKSAYASRLSRVVLHDVYQEPTAIWSGPLFRSATRDGQAMTLTFDHAQGLRAQTGEIQGFAIAGADQKFVWASARVDGDRVIVWNDTVRDPVAVRYGWAGNPRCNLVNAAELPASPFRTDDW